MNLIQKTVACLVSPDVNVWHYCAKKDDPKFFYWLMADPTNTLGFGFNTMEELIEAAYAEIDPLRKPIPENYAPPDFAMEPA